VCGIIQRRKKRTIKETNEAGGGGGGATQFQKNQIKSNQDKYIKDK